VKGTAKCMAYFSSLPQNLAVARTSSGHEGDGVEDMNILHPFSFDWCIFIWHNDKGTTSVLINLINATDFFVGTLIF